MAYVSKELKASIAPTVKAICKKHGVKASLAVRNHSTLVLNIKSSKIDFITNFNNNAKKNFNGDFEFRPAVGHIQVNEYHLDKYYSGKAKQFLTEVVRAMNAENWDKSDIQTDYFCCGYYVNVNIGQWDKPFMVA